MATSYVPDLVEPVDVVFFQSLNDYMKKNISFLTFALARGGTEKVVSILIKELSDDYNVFLVLTSRIIEYPIPENVQLCIINNGTEEDKLISRFLKLPILAWRYYKFCKKNNIDISFSFLNRPNYIACMLRYFGWKKRILISERTSTFLQYMGNSMKSISGRFLVNKLYPKADLIIPNALANMSELKNIYKIRNNYDVIYNPINLANILNRKDEILTDFEEPRFTYLMLGRFVNEKDQLSLVEAFSMLPSKNECRLVLIGHGYNEKKIRNKISELGLEKEVMIIDFVENPYKYLRKADCFVFSTVQEGFPNAIIEALACSLPVISSDCKVGPRELLAPGTDYDTQIKDTMELAEFGILVPVKKPGILAQAMDRIYTDKDLFNRYKENALTRAKAFDIPVIIQQYKDLLSADHHN